MSVIVAAAQNVKEVNVIVHVTSPVVVPAHLVNINLVVLDLTHTVAEVVVEEEEVVIVDHVPIVLDNHVVIEVITEKSQNQIDALVFLVWVNQQRNDKSIKCLQNMDQLTKSV